MGKVFLIGTSWMEVFGTGAVSGVRSVISSAEM